MELTEKQFVSGILWASIKINTKKMTRVKLVPVKELYDQHLLAEHREIKRIPNLIKQ
jgi:hypothetical protein